MLRAGVSKHMVLANLVCATYGDGAGPYFAGHVDYGIHSAGTIERQPNVGASSTTPISRRSRH